MSAPASATRSAGPWRFAPARVLVVTFLSLIAVGTVLLLVFQAVTPRTAGFNTLEIGGMMPASLFLLMILMFVGAAPGGTAGGIKITTFSRIAPALVARVLAISIIGFLALNLTAGILLLVQGRELLPTPFETTSAFGTVGLSMGEGDAPISLAGHFSAAGKLLIIVMLFVGRLGPLTLAVAIARGARPARIRYPEGRFLVG